MTLSKKEFAKKLLKNTQKKIQFLTTLLFIIVSSYCYSQNNAAITLSMEGSYFKVTTTITNDVVTDVLLVNTITKQVYTLPACLAKKCSFTVNHLPSGVYYVIIKTEKSSRINSIKIAD